MLLFNQISELDLKRFENFVDLYGVNKFNYCGNERYLRFWDKNKKNLFKLLGNQLIYEVPFEFTAPNTFTRAVDFATEKENMDFYKKVQTAAYNVGCPVGCLRFINRTNSIEDNAIDWCSETVLDSRIDKKPVKIREGMKYIKAFAKFIEYYELHELKKEFEQYRIRHSMLLADFKIKGTLCLSIHPLDFVTMSDNANSWSSCMSWAEGGCYRAGTVEMMNSEYAIVAYLKTDKKIYDFGKHGSSDEEYQWNSKQYRQLFFVSDEFLLTGKSYPYGNKEITKSIFNLIKELAENNCNWTYNHEDTYEWYYWDTKFVMNMMYNDILNDGDRTYPIAYNFCDADCLEYNLSGEAPCLVCGDLHMLIEDNYYSLEDEGPETYYNSRFKNTSMLYCKDCNKKIHCRCCGELGSETNALAVINGGLCEDCWNAYARLDPVTNEIFVIERNLLNGYLIDCTAYLILDGTNPSVNDFIKIKENKWAVPILASEETLSDLDRKGELIYKDIENSRGFEYRILIPAPNSTIDWSKFFYENLVTPKFIGN